MTQTLYNVFMGYKNGVTRKEYAAKHYQENKALYDARANARRLERVEYVNKIKRENPCTDCGQFYHPCQMQFDHLDSTEKVDAVSKLIARTSIKKIQEEIDKCELVCANCHALRTWKRLQGAT